MLQMKCVGECAANLFFQRFIMYLRSNKIFQLNILYLDLYCWTLQLRWCMLIPLDVTDIHDPLLHGELSRDQDPGLGLGQGLDPDPGQGLGLGHGPEVVAGTFFFDILYIV